MMRRLLAGALATGIAATATMFPARAQQPDDETVTEKIERGVSRIGEELRKSWAEVRDAVDKLGVEGRVYGRLHWDKELVEATIDIQVGDDHAVVLKGSVPSERAKRKAARLTRDTVGVKGVIDELAVFEK